MGVAGEIAEHVGGVLDRHVAVEPEPDGDAVDAAQAHDAAELLAPREEAGAPDNVLHARDAHREDDRVALELCLPPPPPWPCPPGRPPRGPPRAPSSAARRAPRRRP